MKNWKSILLLGLVFLAGVAVGVLGTRTVVRQFVQRAIAQPERVPGFGERDLVRKLRLDDAQREKLRVILADSRQQLRGLRQEFQPQARLVLSNANAQITAILTPEQQVRFEKIRAAKRPPARPPRPEP